MCADLFEWVGWQGVGGDIAASAIPVTIFGRLDGKGLELKITATHSKIGNKNDC